MDEDCEVDVESAEEIPDIGGEATAGTYDEGFHDSEDGGMKSDKREHHNLLERRRRDHIKESFYDLRDCLPQLRGEKVSRAHILNKATEYIRNMQKCGSTRESDIVGLKLRNEVLEQQIKALERHKSSGTSQNAEEILEAVQEEVTSKHKEDQQKQAKKINSLVSEKNDTEGVRSTGGSGVKTRAASAPKKQQSGVPIAPATTASTSLANSDSSTLSSPAISILASNLKSTQNLLTALQKSLPPNANLPANIKTLAQRVLASSPLTKAQLQATSTNALRGVVTATTVTSKQASSTSPSAVKQQPPVVKATPMKEEPSTDALKTRATPVSKPPSQDSKPALVSALTMPTQTPSQPPSSQPTLSPQQILRTAHLLLQQQGSTLNTSPDKNSGSTLSPEMLAQVSSYLNLPAAITNEQSPSSSSSEMLSVSDDGSVSVPNSFLTAALTGNMANALASMETTTTESHPFSRLAKRPGSSSEDDTEQTIKKPRVVL